MSDLKEFIIKHGSVPMDDVREVVHYSAGYDPVKAREYYLRTRELKGRPKGSSESSSLHLNRNNTPKASTNAAKTVSKPKTPFRSRKETEARIKQMKGRLEKLRKLLRELVKEAQARSGIDTSKKKATAGTNKLTTAERKDAAKRQKEYRDKNPEDTSLSAQEKRLAEQIKDINEKISKARADLKSAVAKARAGSAKTSPAAKSRRNT